MTDRVLLRAASGPGVGLGHAMRSRAVAEEVRRLGGRPLVVVDDEATRMAIEADGLLVVTEEEEPEWTREPASAAWIDGRDDWSEVLRALLFAGTPPWLVENRSPARELCDRLVYPALHYAADAWDARHVARVVAGASWIPLAREVRSTRPLASRDVDLLVTFGGSDPFELTERVLFASTFRGRRVVVALGPHMARRRSAIEELAAGLEDARVLDPGTPLAPWMARSRAALTAVGTTLYELAYLGVPALVLANYADDRQALEYYDAHGPHLALGIAAELSAEGLTSALAGGLAELAARPAAEVPGLGEGAERIAAGLLSEAA